MAELIRQDGTASRIMTEEDVDKKLEGLGHGIIEPRNIVTILNDQTIHGVKRFSEKPLGPDGSPFATEAQVEEKATEHTHRVEDVEELQVALDGKADAEHTHEGMEHQQLVDLIDHILDMHGYSESEIEEMIHNIFNP